MREKERIVFQTTSILLLSILVPDEINYFLLKIKEHNKKRGNDKKGLNKLKT